MHIGATDLKKRAFEQMLPAWKNWSCGFPLSIDDVQLQDKDGADIFSETEAISKWFYKKNSRGVHTFRSGKCTIKLLVSNDTVDEVNIHRMQQIEANEEDSLDNITSELEVNTMLQFYVYNPSDRMC